MGIVGSTTIQELIGTLVTIYCELMHGWLDNAASGLQPRKLSWAFANQSFPF